LKHHQAMPGPDPLEILVSNTVIHGMNSPGMKPNIDLRNIDLNLLLVFEAIYRTRNTTRAGEVLHLTQPAVSNALKRLRDLFDDVLFVKSPTGMQPTPRADGIAVLLDEGLASLRLAIQAGQAFDPKTSLRTFHLYVSDIGQAVFIPPLVSRLNKVAPGIQVATTYLPLDMAQQMMKLGQIDLAIGIFSGLHNDFIQQRLFLEKYAVLVRAKHPKIGTNIGVEQFFAAHHIIYTPTAGSHARFEAELNVLTAKAGQTRKVALQLAHSTGIDRIVASSDLIACVPNRIADAMTHSDAVRALPLPFDVSSPEISQFWHERSHRDEGHQWLRSLIFEMFHDKRMSKVR
jgi:DNA-binding transcriptional LysR family regulator